MTTLERLATMEAILVRVEKTMSKLDTSLREHVEWEEAKYRDMDARFAAKWVEYIAVSSIILIISGGITLLFNLV